MKKRIKHFVLYGFFLTSIISAIGCFSHIHHLPAASKTDPAFPLLPPPEDDTIIGIAFSGGGSRAAYFSAAGLEAFSRLRLSPQSPSLLERVAYISSVSGGSVASAYFVMEKPGKNQSGQKESVLRPDGALTDRYRAFFDAYLKTMASDIQGAVVWRQFYKIRWLDSNQRATSLAETLDSSFLRGRTFKDLYEREQQGDAPRLILNTTVYNNGRRAVMTTLPDPVFEYKFFNQLQKELEALPHDRGIKPLPVALKNAQEALIPVTFEDLGADGRGVPLSMAVAASASFPPLIGPITIQVQGDSKHIYHHLGDGGLFDNQGTESLVQLLLQRYKENKKKRALVIAFDSSFPFWGKIDALNHYPNGFKIFANDPGRIVGIMEQRANAYQSAIWHILQNRGILLPDDNTIKVIPIRHTDEVWTEDWKKHIPHECADDADGLKEKKDVIQRLALMPTLFELKSECDRALLNEAAKLAVEHHKDEILGFLNQKPK
jgi:patatin-like phospholipase